MSADGAPRLRKLRDWLADRIGLEELAKTIRAGQVPGGASLWHSLGSVAAGLLVLYIVASIGKDLYADLLWFDSVGYRSIYTTRLTARIWLFFAGAGAFLALITASIFTARRLAPSADDPDFEVTEELREVFDELQSALGGGE